MATIYKNGVVREMTEAENSFHSMVQSQIADLADERQAKASRLLRDARLASCDWTQAADSPLSSDQKAAWATYRAELRNLPTADENWPDSETITWPDEPS
jgi:hypothetical protein